MDEANIRRMKHRRASYQRYEVIVEQGTLLQAILDRYKELHPGRGKDKGNGLSRLVRECLCERFGISEHDLYVEHYIDRATGEKVKASGRKLESYFSGGSSEEDVVDGK